MILYVVVLWDGGQGPLLPDAYYDNLLVPLFLGLAAAAAARLPMQLREPVLLAVLLILCATVLTDLWASGPSNGFMIAGALPLSDAASYYNEALNLLHGGSFLESASRRPLFSGLLATILDVSNQRLGLTLEILAAIVAISLVTAVIEVARTEGWTGAGLLLFGLFFFARRYLPLTMTETLGFSLGCLGFAALWRAAHGGGPRYALFGLLLLTLALNARAGAFFILPALVLWGAWVFREKHRISARFVGLGVAAVIVGFALNAVLLYCVGIPAAAFSNHAQTFYGLVFGGDWSLALRDHPEFSTLAPADLAVHLDALALEHIRVHPSSLLNGVLRAWSLFIPTAFAFMKSNTSEWFEFIHIQRSRGLWVAARAVLAAVPSHGALNFLAMMGLYATFTGLMVIGALRLFTLRPTPATRMLLFGALGILLSVPFAPPWDGGVRIYAATIPFTAMLPALGVALLRDRRPIASVEYGPRSMLLIPTALVVMMLALPGPLIAAARSSPAKFALTQRCGSDRTIAAIWRRDTVVRLVDGAGADGKGRRVTVEDLRRGMQEVEALYPDRAKLLTSLAPGTALALAYDPVGQRLNYFVGPAAAMLSGADGAPHRICAHPASPAAGDAWLLQVTSIWPMSDGE